MRALKTSGKCDYPLGGSEGQRTVEPQVMIDLRRVATGACLPARATEIRTIRTTLANLTKTLERLGIGHDALERAGLGGLEAETNAVVADNGMTTERLATNSPGLVALGIILGGHFRQSTWNTFTDAAKLIQTIKNIYNMAPIEFSWATVKLGPDASLSNKPDLGEVGELLLVTRAIDAIRNLTGTGPSGIIVSDESAAFFEFSSRTGIPAFPFDNTPFRNEMMALMNSTNGRRSPIVFVSHHVDKGRFLSLEHTYRNDGERNERVGRTSRIIAEAISAGSVLLPHTLTALLDARIRDLPRDMAVDAETMRQMDGKTIRISGSEDPVPLAHKVVHITKINRPGELSGSSLGTETAHGVPVIVSRNGNKPVIRIVPESEFLAEVEGRKDIGLARVTGLDGTFLCYHMGMPGESLTAPEMEEAILRVFDGAAVDLKSVRSPRQVVMDFSNQLRR